MRRYTAPRPSPRARTKVAAVVALLLAACADAEVGQPAPPTRALKAPPGALEALPEQVQATPLQVGEATWELFGIEGRDVHRTFEVVATLAVSHHAAAPRRVTLLPLLVDAHGDVHAPAEPASGATPTLARDLLLEAPLPPGTKRELVLRYLLPKGGTVTRIDFPGLTPLDGMRSLMSR
jgi:hypothetical protein